MSLHETTRKHIIPIVSISASILITISSVLFSELWFLVFVPIILCGIPIVREIIEDAKKHEISAECLVMMGIIGCLIIGEYLAAAEIAIIMAVGELLEDAISDHARSGMDSLSRLRCDKANKIVNGEPVSVALEEVSVGDIIRVRPGENIPLDGVVAAGHSSIDKSIITGESVPEDVSDGSQVFAGTSNRQGSIDILVTKTESDSTISHMTRLLKNADASKSRIVSTADRMAKYIIAGAVTAAAVTYLATMDIYRALTIIVVFCSCAFVIATPTTIMAAAGNMTKNGILLRNATSIEALAKIDTVVFDKTGTLTTGHMSSSGFKAVSESIPDNIEGMVSSLESYSDHPLGTAIAECHPFYGKVTEFIDVPGKGIVGCVEGYRIAAGNKSMMMSECPEGLEKALMTAESSETTVVYIGVDGETVGFFSLEDPVKESAHAMMQELKDMGIKTVMLTGDNDVIGKKVARTLNIDDAVCNCLPETKMESITNLELTTRVCMIGDGMNDAPSLKRSTVGISMGSIGNDLAVNASDMVFMNDDIGKIPGLIRLCKRSLMTIYAGLTLSMSINIIGVILAIMGAIGPITGAIIHNGGSFFVISLAASVLWCNTWTRKTK